LTIDSVRDAESRHQTVACEVHDSMGVSNGTTALGIAVALCEVADAEGRADLQGSRSLFVGGVLLVRRRADQAQIVLLGNKAAPAGRTASAMP